jgi:molybdopterin-containing oxidoreductase family membrane subunit
LTDQSVAGPAVPTPDEVPSELLVAGDPSYRDVTAALLAPLERPARARWWLALFVALAALGWGVAMAVHLLRTGLGTWGINRTVGWGLGVTNFVFWIGIGHAGTLISAVLLLFRQQWRTAVARAAEAMTIFAVCCAALFPILHTGRPWLAYFMLPYPNSRGSLWLNFRSPLQWDVFAIATYLIVSLSFLYLGMIPDFALRRDRASGRSRWPWGALALGWDGSQHSWHRHQQATQLLAGLATPLVVSVHTVVSLDFAVTVVPGWHATVFPPYFVAGAIFSGLAMVLTLVIAARRLLGLERFVTARHLDRLAKLLLAAGLVVSLAYATEIFATWYGGSRYERFALFDRATGPYGWACATMLGCNVVVPQLLWLRRVRRSPAVLFCVSILVNLGMWLERFTIVVTPLYRDYLPSSWSHYSPTLVEVGMLVGSFGLFFTLFLLFVRVVPIAAVHELKLLLAEQRRTGR